MSPRISVLMPVWNGERYLSQAVESILTQGFSDFELLAVDDGSTDGTIDILKSYRDQRIKIYQLQHGGIVKALNFGVGRASAQWIARQDADDISLPDRLERQWTAVQNNIKSVLCFTDISLIGENAPGIRMARLPNTKALIALKLCYQCPIAHSSVLFRKKAFFDAGGYIVTERHAEDYALWGRMLELGEFVVVPEKFVQLRVHSASVSKQNLEIQNALSFAIAVEHCIRFMNLDHQKATRAAMTLRQMPNDSCLREWFWFLRKCAPSLRWHSIEAYAWLGWQTLQRAFGIG